MKNNFLLVSIRFHVWFQFSAMIMIWKFGESIFSMGTTGDPDSFSKLQIFLDSYVKSSNLLFSSGFP